jgi:hypothetical protein
MAYSYLIFHMAPGLERDFTGIGMSIEEESKAWKSNSRLDTSESQATTCFQYKPHGSCAFCRDDAYRRRAWRSYIYKQSKHIFELNTESDPTFGT